MSKKIIPESVEIVLMLSMCDAILLRADRSDGAVPIGRVVEVALSYRQLFHAGFSPAPVELTEQGIDGDEPEMVLIFDALGCECDTSRISVMLETENLYMPFADLLRLVVKRFGIGDGMARQVIAHAALAAAQLEGLASFGALAQELSH